MMSSLTAFPIASPVVSSVSGSTLTQLFLWNQGQFYRYIASFNEGQIIHIKPNANDNKQMKSLEAIITAHPKYRYAYFSFYNSILNNRFIADNNNNDNNNNKNKSNSNDTESKEILPSDIPAPILLSVSEAERSLRSLIALASGYGSPLRLTIPPNATNEELLLKRLGFLCIPSRPDSYMAIDLHETKNVDKLKNGEWNIEKYLNSKETNIFINEQLIWNSSDNEEWARILVESFSFQMGIDVLRPLYADIWKNVITGPDTPIRLYLARHGDPTNGKIIGGSMLSKAHGVAVIFNVVNLKEYRGKGVGKALSSACILGAAQENYRYILLQASPLGAPVYKKLGFTPLPSYKFYAKVGHISLFCKLVEAYIHLFGFTKRPIKITATIILTLILAAISWFTYKKYTL